MSSDCGSLEILGSLNRRVLLLDVSASTAATKLSHDLVFGGKAGGKPADSASLVSLDVSPCQNYLDRCQLAWSIFWK